MSEKRANFIMTIGVILFSVPLGTIISEWIIEEEVFFSVRIYTNVVLVIIGLIVILASRYMEWNKRKIILSLVLLIIPMIVSIALISHILWNSDHNMWMIIISLEAAVMTVLMFFFLYRLGVFAKGATDQSVFGNKGTNCVP